MIIGLALEHILKTQLTSSDFRSAEPQQRNPFLSHSLPD